MKRVPSVLILFMAVLLRAGSVSADFDAFTIADVHMHEGPGTSHAIITTIPARERVYVFECLDDRDWCDVEWLSYRGYVQDRYLSEQAAGDAPDIVAPPIIIYDDDVYQRRYRKTYRKRRGFYRQSRRKFY